MIEVDKLMSFKTKSRPLAETALFVSPDIRKADYIFIKMALAN